jgi:hypothetical protein
MTKTKTKTVLILTLLAALLLPAGAAAQQRVMPRDDATQVPSFFRFRAQLAEALRRKDKVFVREMLHPDIKLSFGGEHGLDDFEAMWKLDDPESRFWETLLRTLSLGGRGDEKRFIAPYVYSEWPEDVDPFDFVAVIEDQAALHAVADAGSAVLARLSYEIVRPLEQEGVGEWTRVRTGGGAEGYVRAGVLRSPVDYRAFFELEDGRWRMTIFLAGD